MVGAASTTRHPDLAARASTWSTARAAVLRFDGGAIGSFANTRRLASATIEIEFISEGFITTLTKRPERGQGDWHARYDDGTAIRSISNGTDPYERQAAAFLDAVKAGDPSRVLSTLCGRAQDRPADPGRGRRDRRDAADRQPALNSGVALVVELDPVAERVADVAAARPEGRCRPPRSRRRRLRAPHERPPGHG